MEPGLVATIFDMTEEGWRSLLSRRGSEELMKRIDDAVAKFRTIIRP
jgi:hypothetical protein